MKKNKLKVLISTPYMQNEISRFKSILLQNNIDVIIPAYIKEKLEEDDLFPLVKDIDGAIVGDDCFSKRVLISAPKLRVICRWGTGIDSIDLKTANHLGIKVFNVPNAFTEPVADTVVGYMLCFARNLCFNDNLMKSGGWKKIMGVSLQESTLGVIGVGNIGKAVLRRAKAFGMRLLGNDIKPINNDFISEVVLQLVTKEELLRESDFVSLNCDLNPTSYRLINESALQIMKNTAVLINTARGSVIDESALISALKKKCIKGAALDVFEKEPLPQNSALRKLENVILGPHIANSSPSCWEQVHQITIKNLIEALI